MSVFLPSDICLVSIKSNFNELWGETGLFVVHMDPDAVFSASAKMNWHALFWSTPYQSYLQYTALHDGILTDNSYAVYFFEYSSICQESTAKYLML